MSRLYIIISILSFFFINTAFAETKILANVGNEIITNIDVVNNLKFYKSIHKKAIPEKEVLETLINQILLEEEFKAYRIEVSKKEISDYIKDFSRDKLHNNSSTAWLKANNLPKDFLEKRAIYDVSLQKFIDQVIIPRINISENEVNEHFKLIKIADKFDIKQISLNKNNFANIYSNLQKVKSCAEFDQTLKNHSIPSPSILRLNVQDLDPNMHHFLSNLSPGQVSHPIEASDGSLQIFIVCKANFKSVSEDMKPRVKGMLIEKKVAQRLETYVKILRKKANL